MPEGAVPEKTASPVRYAKRWKRRLGYFLVLISSAAIMAELRKTGFPQTDVGLNYYVLNLSVTLWGVWFIARNPKAKERSGYPGGDPSLQVAEVKANRRTRVIVVVALIWGLLVIYGWWFMPRH